MKDGAEEIAYVLTHLINRSLVSATFLTEEKIGKISPIHKSEEKTQFDNYRPISVLNIASKILLRIIHRQLYGKSRSE